MITSATEPTQQQSSSSPVDFFDGEACSFTVAVRGLGGGDESGEPQTAREIRETHGYIDGSINGSINGSIDACAPAQLGVDPREPTDWRVALQSCQTSVVRHSPMSAPRGCVLLCGSIGVERERSHRTLVDLARAIACAGFECYRFDFAGNGESTGRFEDQSFSSWRAQAEMVVRRVEEARARRASHATHGDDSPATREKLVLFGVRAGALIAAELFAAGIGDAAFVCSPADAQVLLNDMARRAQVAEMLTASRAAARPAASANGGSRRLGDILTSGESTTVDGYRWTPQLWSDAALHRVPACESSDGRCMRSVEIQTPRPSPNGSVRPSNERVIECDRFWESSLLLVPRSSALKSAMLSFIASHESLASHAAVASCDFMRGRPMSDAAPSSLHFPRRRCSAVPCEGQHLVVTVHSAAPTAAPTAALTATRPARRGFLMLNPGPAPRAGNSDFSARLCDRIAGLGIPSFRLDFAGVGDSTGDSWTTLPAYREANDGGANRQQVTAVMERLCAQHNLDGLYLGGLCAGAANAVGAVRAHDQRLAGCVLFEPKLEYTPNTSSATTAGGTLTVPHVSFWKKLQDLDLVLGRGAGILDRHRVTHPLARVLHAWLAHRSEKHLPASAHLPTVNDWSAVLERGIPMLSVVAQDEAMDLYLERVARARHFASHAHHQVTRLAHANHLLTAEGAAERAIEATVEWMSTLERARLR